MFPGGTFQKSNNYWDCEAVKVKKKTIRRGLFGLPTGIAIGFVITLIISACVGDGSFYPVTPELIGAMGNELNAVILQTVLCAVVGAGFAAASVIWELDSWSLAKQSGIYFLTISIIMLPVAYFANWMKHSLAGVLSYAGIFTAIFVVVWISQYLLWKRNIKRMNAFVSEEALNELSRLAAQYSDVNCTPDDIRLYLDRIARGMPVASKAASMTNEELSSYFQSMREKKQGLVCEEE